MKLINHLKTITRHRHLVMKKCFKCGLYKQGLTHDLSKYLPSELYVYRYWTGKNSPISNEKKEHGFSRAWLHHKGRNKHHLEYWLDNSHEGTIAYTMPDRYVAELICDRIAASQNYLGDEYNDNKPYEYHQKTKNDILIHPKTQKDIESALIFLKENGEDELMKQIKKRKKEMT